MSTLDWLGAAAMTCAVRGEGMLALEFVNDGIALGPRHQGLHLSRISTILYIYRHRPDMVEFLSARKPLFILAFESFHRIYWDRWIHAEEAMMLFERVSGFMTPSGLPLMKFLPFIH